MESTIIFDPSDVERRLAELGLETRPIITAVQAGVFAQSTFTRNHPRLAIFSGVWGEIVRTLRDELSPAGWVAKTIDGVDLVVNLEGTIGINVAGGDARTGIADSMVATRSPRGPRTVDYVRHNQLTLGLDLFEDPDEGAIVNIVSMVRTTYTLLTFRDELVREVRCELSLGAGMTRDRKTINDWTERIILPIVGFDADPGITRSAPSSDPFDFTVTRRGA